MSSKKILLAGVSVAALGISLSLPHPALAAASINWGGGTIVLEGSFSGAATGVNAIATSGTLTNTGTLSGTIYGIKNSGTIDALSNRGTISGNSTGIHNSGAIGRLSNSGRIEASGGGYALVNATGATITTLINRGQINGGSVGVVNNGIVTTLVNSGTITQTRGGSGIANWGGTIGTLVNSGLITYTQHGIENGVSISALTNSGRILSGNGNGTGVQNDPGATLGILTNTGTIVGYRGIFNWGGGGSIGILVNQGLIHGSAVGISNAAIGGAGTIGTLTNSGTIRGGQTGVVNAGTIDTLTNSGLISGASKAINNTGTLDTITNTGTIAGNISSFNPVTVNGAAGSAFGTLTGYTGGSRGTITSNAVVFDTGNTFLNDDINGSATVKSATLKVSSPVTIVGGYTQTGGGLALAGGSLTVGGNANVTGTAITLMGSDAATGSHTIVSAAIGGTYTGDTVAALGYSARYATIGNDLVVTVGGPLFTGATQTMADLINANATSSGFAPFVNALASMPSTQWGKALGQLQPSQVAGNAALLQGAGQISGEVGGAIGERTSLALAKGDGAAAGSTRPTSAAWGRMLGGTASRDASGDAQGYDLDTWGLVFGADTHVSPEAIVGAALSWGRGWLNGTGDVSGTANVVDSWQMTGYAAWARGPWMVNGQLGYGLNQFQEKRDLSLFGQQVGAHYYGHQYSAAAEAGYALPVGGATLTPTAGLRWLRLDTGGYQESGGSAAMSVAASSTDQVESALGGKLSYPLQLGSSRIVPEVKAAWLHDFTNGNIATTAQLGGASFTTATPRPEADGAALGAGLTLQATDAVSLQARYDGHFRSDYRAHTGMIEVRTAF